MLWYRETGDVARFDHDDMASSLAIAPPSGPLECPHRVGARDDRKPSHQTETSISRVDIVTGIPLAILVSTHACMASRIFSNASFSVLPCEIHPGMAGHSTTIIP